MNNIELAKSKVDSIVDEFAKLNILIEAIDIHAERASFVSESEAPFSSSLNGASPSPNPHGMFVGFEENEVSSSFATWFSLWDGIAGAAHSVEGWPGGIGWRPGQDRSGWDEWTQVYDDDDIIIRPGGLDIALFGCKLPRKAPAQMRVKERIRIRGYPAGVTINDHYEVRNGHAYMERPEEHRNGDAASWIVVLDDGSRPAMGGMSGGPVTIVNQQTGAETLAGVLITQNGRADLNFDGVKEHSSDIVSLETVYMKLKSG